MDLRGNVDLAVAAAFGVWLVLTCADACEIVTNEAVQNSAWDSNNIIEQPSPMWTYASEAIRPLLDRQSNVQFPPRSIRAQVVPLPPIGGALGARLQHVIPPNVDFDFVVILSMADVLLSQVVRMSAMAQSSSTGKLTSNTNAGGTSHHFPHGSTECAVARQNAMKMLDVEKVELATANFGGLRRYG